MTIKPSAELYAHVRAGFVQRQTTLNKFCIENNIVRQNARAALRGERGGAWAQKLVDRLVDASGINASAEVKK